MEQRRRLGISGPSLQSSPQNTLHETTSALEITEVYYNSTNLEELRPGLLLIFWLFYQIEKAKQDNALSDLSNLLGELKEMAVDMGAELDRFVSNLFFITTIYILLRKEKRKPFWHSIMLAEKIAGKIEGH